VDGFLFSLIPTLIVLGVLIFVHELGHFLACKQVGVAVEKFSIGFGPEIFHFNYQETRIAVSLIPFGGFVKPKGESAEELNGKELAHDDYMAKGVPAKALIVSAGVFMNFVLAFILFMIIFLVGRPIMKPVVGGLVKDYPAKAAGVLPGDEILSVNGKGVDDWNALTLAIITSKESSIHLEINREGKLLPITVESKQDSVDIGGKSKQKIKRIGIKPSDQFEIEKLSFFPALRDSGKAVVTYTVLTYRILWGLITGEISFRNIAGPVGIMAITGKTAEQGIISLLQLMALLSVNLAIINLLPIPALDGGHLLFLGFEAVRRKPINQIVQERITQVGFVCLIGLMVFVVINDVQNFEILAKIKAIFGK